MKARVAGVLGIWILIQAGALQAALPEQVNPPTRDEATWLIEALFDEEPPAFLPFEFPKDVDRSDSQQLALLNLWFERKMLTRDSIRFNAVKVIQGRKRKVSVAGFRFALLKEAEGVSARGFIYGRAKIKELISVSEPRFIGHTFYSEAYIKWYVDNLPDWAQLPLMQKSYRPLRRASESFEKPFEKRFYFEFQEDVGWVLWKDKPKGMVQPLF